MDPRVRTGLKVACVAGAAAACVYAGTWLSAASFAAVNERTIFQTAPHVKFTSLGRYWREYGDDPVQRGRLQKSMAVSYGLTCALLPALLVIGATARRRSLFGDARFANTAEITDAKLLGGDGIIVGKYRGRYLTYPGQQYVWVAAPPRSGKGRGIAVPNLLNWNGSALVLDFKTENWQLTAGFRAQCGHEVHRFSPFDERGRTSRYNPLGYVRTDALHRVSDLLAIGNIVYPEPAGDSQGSSKFFADSARNLFLAIGLYLLETPELPRTFGQMLRIASGNGKPFHEYIANLIKERTKENRPLSRECVDAFNRFLANAAQVFSSILSTFNAPLTIFMDPKVDAATSANDFDLSEVRKRRISVYLCIPFKDVPSSRLLVNLLFTQAINLNTQERPEDNPEVLKHQCLLLLDEFAVPGRIDVLTRSIGLMPGYNMRVLIICQSESQVAFEYGRDTAKTIRTAMGMQVLFPPKEQEDAEQYSRMLDNCTEKIRNRSTSTGKGGHSTSTSEQQQKRPLMLPQEIKRLPDTKQIIVMEKCLPILCGRANYDADPELDRRSKIAPPDVPALDLDTHVARINECVRDLQPGEGETEPLPADRYAHDFTGMPPLAENATDADRESYSDGFFEAVLASARAEVAQEEEPAPQATPARKKAASPAKPRKKKVAPATVDEANFAAEEAALEEPDDLDLSGLHN